MNLLAHLHLGRHLPPVPAAGNLLADFIKLPPDGSPYFAGVRLHQAIDAFTDRHELVARARNLFQPPRRRFAGILVDLAFDYCLTRSWDRFHPGQPVEVFVDQQLRSMRAAAADLPAGVAMEIERFAHTGILLSGQSLAGLGGAIHRITARRPVTLPMRGAEQEIAALEPSLLPLFCAFYPNLQDHARREFHTNSDDNLGT